MPKEKEVFVEGMHCDSCEVYVESVVSGENGVRSVLASSKTSTIKISVESEDEYEKIIESINKKITNQGYEIKGDKVKQKLQFKELFLQYIAPVIGGALLMIIMNYFMGNSTALTNLISGEFSWYTALILGFIASISTCMAVVGGVAMTFSASVSKESKKSAITYFHVSRILGFVLLGGVAGYIGKLFIITGYYSRIIEIIISLMMIFVGLDMLGIKLLSITFPKSISKRLGIFSDKDKTLSGALLGIGTFFLPCGMTQAVQMQALSTGSFILGAQIMGAFALGSLPVLLLLSSGSAKATSLVHNKSIQNFLAGVIITNSLIALLTVLL